MHFYIIIDTSKYCLSVVTKQAQNFQFLTTSVNCDNLSPILTTSVLLLLPTGRINLKLHLQLQLLQNMDKAFILLCYCKYWLIGVILG